jgi:hypothetical protein
MEGRNCSNCGLPSWGTNSKGFCLKLKTKPRFGKTRCTKHTVWVCSEECAYQALAVARYGPAASRWPVTLAQFRSMTDLKPFTVPDEGSDVTKSTLQDVDSTGPKTGLFSIMAPEAMEGMEGGFPSQKQRGRPRKESRLSGAERTRRYRQKEAQEAACLESR